MCLFIFIIDEWQVDVSTRANYIFFTVPPSDKPEFPLAINALPRSNSGKHKQPKVIGGCQIISSKKVFLYIFYYFIVLLFVIFLKKLFTNVYYFL